MCYLSKVIRQIDVPKNEAIVCCRSWNEGLRPLFFFNSKKTQWTMTGIAEANKKPTLNNPYGLHAFRSKKLLLDACRIDITKPWFMPNLPIIGTIKIWGRVVEHENGYRAQYAEIVNITKGKALIFEEKKGEIYPPL